MNTLEIAANKVATTEELLQQPETNLDLDGNVRFEGTFHDGS